ncbi:glycerate kinase [Cryobacterium tepidiphilum]|uniref:Glycerate kinase n=1 Tax=Cryobacterium tepidiphilum TaxID=2486026 RepID=A0A3M8L9Q1_9MICO|nr:glycerate kinase [Cryobacterium tepidiphilum]RNE62227.1 glycerate kinase [Cryobacterium tepidiphilum]
MPAFTVVIAPDSFKGTATAVDVADAIASGWASVRPNDVLRHFPMADGGEGTLDAFAAAVPGATRMPVTVQGPDDRPVDSCWLLLPDGTGVVELANTSGLGLLDRLRPLDAHTLGFGQAIAAALDHGVDRLLLAVGGSSSTDGGAGALTALGARFLDAEGQQIALGNRGLGDLDRVDLSDLRALPAGGATVLSDVTSPLLGPAGAASVFGAQKGADATQLRVMEANLAALATRMPAKADLPGTGAAGGTAFGLVAWGAVIAAGSGAVGDAVGLPGAISGADIVITGEGRFDDQSDAGKVASYVRGLAEAADVTALLVAGSIGAETRGFVGAQSLTELAGSSAAAMGDPLRYLRVAGTALAASGAEVAAARS